MRIRTYDVFVCDQSEGRGDLHAVTIAVNGATAEQLAACDAIAAKVRGVQAPAFTAGEGRYVVRQTPTARHKWRHYGEADAEHVAAKAAKLAEQFREGLSVKRGPKSRPPWLAVNSRDAGLPTERAAWLARVLEVLDSTASYAAADKALGVPHETATRWCAWLRAEQVAGRLPERTAPLPEHATPKRRAAAKRRARKP